MATTETSRIAAAKERAEHAKTLILAAALIAFFGAMAMERGAHASSTPGGSSPAVSSEDSDDGFGFFDDGGLAPAQGQPSTSMGTS